MLLRPTIENDCCRDSGIERFGARMHGNIERDVAEFESECANQGLYAKRMTLDEYALCASDPAAADELFGMLMRERLTRWLNYAQERLVSTDVKILTAPGNDDRGCACLR